MAGGIERRTKVKAAWYERNGKARDVLTIGEMPDPKPAQGEVRVKMTCSGLNPTDVKRREGTRGQNIEFPRVIPNSDGAGIVESVGPGVKESWKGKRVWVWNAQWGARLAPVPNTAACRKRWWRRFLTVWTSPLALASASRR